MRKTALALVLVALVAAIFVQAAAAGQLHANVLSWSPNDVQPREPVSVVLKLYTPGNSLDLDDDRPVVGVNDVEVVIRGDGQARSFATEEVGGGRYRADIVFPAAGGWNLRVRYGDGPYGPSNEILLGKGAVCVGGEICVDAESGRAAPAEAEGRTWTPFLLAGGGALIIIALAAAILARLGAFHRRRGSPRPA